MILRTIWAVLIVICWSVVGYSQANKPIVIFHEIIQRDSIMMFFNERHRFTEKPCFKFVRYTRINNNGEFNSYFEDKGRDDKLLGKGNYVDGMKHGYFEVYHPGRGN
jgi:hypothetical protein